MAKLEWDKDGMISNCGRYWLQREHQLHERPCYYIMEAQTKVTIPPHLGGDIFSTKQAAQRRCQKIEDYLTGGK